jgi:hypothetical protein
LADPGVPDRLYRIQHVPDAPLQIGITAVDRSAVAGPANDLSDAPVITRQQFGRLLERNKLPAVDPDEYFRRQEAIRGPGTTPTPLRVQMPLRYEPPPLFVDLNRVGSGAISTKPGSMAATVTAGFGPVAIPPTPTAAGSLDRFLEQVWHQRAAIAGESVDVHELYSRRVSALPAPADPAGYFERATTQKPQKVQLGHAMVPLADVVGNSQVPPDTHDFYHYGTASIADTVYRVYLTVDPAHALDVMSDVVTTFVEGESLKGRVTAKVAGAGMVGTRRDTILVTAPDLPTAERMALHYRRLSSAHPGWFVHDNLPMADPIAPGVSLAVTPPSRAIAEGIDYPSFGADRSRVITEALGTNPADSAAFRRTVHEKLLAGQVSPREPHAQLDLLTLAPERRAWLQAGGSALHGYRLGGIRSSAATSTGLGGGLGLLFGGGSILLDPGAHPHVTGELLTSAGLGAVGGAGSGYLEFALNASRSPIAYTTANATWSTGWSRMIRPRAGVGFISGGLTAPLTTIAVMGIDRTFYGTDYTAIDFAAKGARAAAVGAPAGAVGTGVASLSTFMAGGAAAGSSMPIIGNIAGAALGWIAYLGFDSLYGEKVQSVVQDLLGEGGCQGRAVPE